MAISLGKIEISRVSIHVVGGRVLLAHGLQWMAQVLVHFF